jgi:YidC/Oxa1 family membrane protein insertase
MDQMRLLFALVLSFLVFMLWNVFFQPETAKKPIPQLKQEAQKADPQEAAVAAAPSVDSAAAAAKPVPTAAAPDRPARQIKVETPLYEAVLSEKGAAITGFTLKRYRETAAAGSPFKGLFPQDAGIDGLFVGFNGDAGGGLESAQFQAGFPGDRLSLSDGSREIAFSFVRPDGIQVEKIYRFSADSYVLGFEVRLVNGSDKTVQGDLFVALRNLYPPHKKSYAFEGPSALVEGKHETVPLDEIEKKGSLNGNITWMALESRYFVTSLIPLKQQAAAVRLKQLPEHVVEARYVEPGQTLAPGNRQQYDFELFFGPKSMESVKQAGHQLERIIDFGYFDILAKPCLWLMNFFYSVIPNYGVAIIILTVLSKIVLWPLGTKSYKSMSQMKKLQPLIQEIREKYKNDRKRMNEEVMRLHRTYNINPLGGCLPMLVQIPVFFALYRMLDMAIELRHAPFVGWINDLSAPDRLFHFDFAIPFMEPPYGIPVLTLIMGASMFLQQKMTPTAGDPAQAKMMMLMPVVFTFIFINFSSGLVLYWLVSNVLSIGQQYYTQKKFS